MENGNGSCKGGFKGDITHGTSLRPKHLQINQHSHKCDKLTNLHIQNLVLLKA